MRINTLLNDDAPTTTPSSKGPGRGNWSRNRKTKHDAQALADGASPSANGPTSSMAGPHGFYLPLNGTEPSHKRTRPLTQHQLAVEQYRRRRVEVILDRGIRVEWKQAAKRRRKNDTFIRAWRRCKTTADGYDTDEESTLQAIQQQDIEVGVKMPPPMFAGMVPTEPAGEPNDYGEEAYTHAKMISRVLRRLDRWEGGREVVRTKDRSKDSAVWHERNGEAGEDRQELEDEGDVDDDVDEEMQDIDDAARDEEMDDSEEEDEPQRYDLPPLSSLT